MRTCSLNSFTRTPTVIGYFVGLLVYMVTSTHEQRRNAGDLRIGNKIFEAVQSFQYLGNNISNINNNNKCIKERIMMGNKAYYADTQLFTSSLISRNSKLQIYRTLENSTKR